MNAHPTRPGSRRLATFATLALLGCLAAAAPAHANAPAEPVAVDASFQPQAMAAQLLSVSDTQALKGLKRVAVSQFSVTFVTFDSAKTQTSGFGAAGRASASASLKLVGVGKPEFAALTEALHGAFVAQLQAAGLEVVPASEVQAAPSYRKLVAGGTPTPVENTDSMLLSAGAAPVYGTAKLEATTAKKPGLFSGFAAFGDAMSAVGAASDVMELGKELGGAAVLEVSLRVHFAQLTDHNKGFWGRMASSAEVSGKAVPQLAAAALSVQQGAVVARIALKQPLVFDPAAFKEVREEPTSKAEVAGALLGGLLRLASGSKDTHSSARFEAVADPERWRAVLGAGIGRAGEMLVARLNAER